MDYITSLSGISLIAGTDMFVGKMPASPDNCVAIYDTPSRGQLLDLDGANGYEYAAVQIRVRNRKYDEGWQMVSDIVSYLHGERMELNGALYLAVFLASGPAFLRWDEQDRAEFVVNFNVQRRT